MDNEVFKRLGEWIYVDSTTWFMPLTREITSKFGPGAVDPRHEKWAFRGLMRVADLGLTEVMVPADVILKWMAAEKKLHKDDGDDTHGAEAQKESK